MISTDPLHGVKRTPRRVEPAARKTKVPPSQQGITGTKPKRTPGELYTTMAYDHAVAQGRVRAGVPHWHPHQLRHAVATVVRREFGLEAAQANVTEVYAERDLALAAKVAGEMG